MTWTARNNGDPCHLGTTNATGDFRTNGQAGTVKYEWVRYDSSNNVVGTSAVYTITMAQFDYSVHTVTPDSFSPTGLGHDQLHFLSPTFPDSSVTGTKTWSCNGH